MQGKRQCGLAPGPPGEPEEEQDGKNSRVNQRLADVLLYRPQKVDRPERGDRPNQAVEALPSASQPPDRALRRRHGEGDHQHEGRHPDRDVQMLRDILDDVTEVEEHVEADVHRQVHACVAERDQPERATVPGEPVPAREAPERSDGEGQREKPERPEPGLNLELLDGVRAEVIGQGATGQPGDGEEADDEERNRREAPAVRPLPLARDRRRRQKNFLRSIPEYRRATWSP